LDGRNNLTLQLPRNCRVANAKAATSLPSHNALDVSGFRHLEINHAKLFVTAKTISNRLASREKWRKVVGVLSNIIDYQ
jgi:hypothetical protein